MHRAVRRAVRRACGVLIGVYAILCGMALLVVPLSAIGAFGLQPDPLAAVFAVTLALPWSLLLDRLGSENSTMVNLVIVALAMALNGAILFGLCRLLTGRR